MLREERWEEAHNAVSAAITGAQSRIWTTMPAIVESYNPKDNTIEAKPAIMLKQRMADGTTVDRALPMCVDVPVQFPSGGGGTLTFPVAKGDEVLLHFSMRCIDGWWAKGGVQPQAFLRMHDPSDGFAALGYRSQKNALKNPSTTSIQLRTDDQTTYIEIGPVGSSATCATGTSAGATGATGPTGASISLAAAKDLNIVVKGKASVNISNDCTVTISGNASIAVGGSVKLTADGKVNIDGGPVVLNGGSQQVARVGDTVTCPAGIGHITQGAAKVLA